MKQRFITYTSIFILLISIISCKVGPNYQKPVVENPEIFRYENNSVDSIINLKWWELFQDPILDSLIVEGLRNNKDVLIAASRVEQARANLGYNKADYGPKVGVQANAGGTNFNGADVSGSTYSSYGASATLNWEIDFWGKFRRSTEAAQAAMLGSFYGKRAVEIRLISEIASNYFQLMNFRTSLQISENTLEIRDNALTIIQDRFDEGYTNIIDVNQAQIQKTIAQAAIPIYKRRIAFVENNLSVLLGKNPQQIAATNTSFESYPLPKEIPAGIPSVLLQRRPDLLQSEQLYKQQNALIGVATAMRFPSISLTGVLGVGSSEMSNLLTNGVGWGAGASLLSPLFEWGKNARRVDIERERAKQYLLSYEKNVLSAFRDVNNSLVEISSFKEELLAYKLMVAAASNASKLSYERYYQGVTSYLEVIENQRQEFEAELQYSRNYQELLISYVNLYQSLGGGWITPEEIDKYAVQVANEPR